MGGDSPYGGALAQSQGYSPFQQPDAVYDDGDGGGGGGGTTPAPVIHLHLNPKSRESAAILAGKMAGIGGLPAELKRKGSGIRYNKATKTIDIPNLTGQTASPKGDWAIDIGAAGDGWEVTTAELQLVLDGGTFFRLVPDLQNGEERGYQMTVDPDDSLTVPSRDMDDINSGLITGLTIPNSVVLALNKSVPTVPPPEVCRLKSRRGLILIADRVTVWKGGNFAGEKARKPKEKIVIKTVSIASTIQIKSLFHELSAHASYFQQGKDAAHHKPKDPGNHPVDRNEAQIEEAFSGTTSADFKKLEITLRGLVLAMNKAVP